MTIVDTILSPGVIAIAAVVSWVSALTLLWASGRADPRVNALNERAWIAVLLSLFLTVYAIVSLNSEIDFALILRDDARRIVRLGVIVLGVIGPTWLFMWWTGRLGDKT
jgi:hypothetical protein